jgi:CRISPR-associated protein Cas2
MSDLRLYIVAYDISNPKRWRKVFKTMNGFGEWLQFSVFQCLLSDKRRVEMEAALNEVIHHQEDQIIVLDIGLADQKRVVMSTIGKPASLVKRESIII